MDSFTNSGLTGLLIKTVRQQDPDMTAGISAVHPMKKAIQPDAPKRDLIERVMEKHGPAMLLRVGQHLRDIAPTPTFRALTATPEPAVIAAKWMRLEQYNHASHRTRIDIETPGRWCCIRASKSTPATAGENYLIAGILLGLLTLTGVRKPALILGGRLLTPATLAETRGHPPGSADRFDITWDASGTQRQPTGERTSGNDTTSQRLADLLSGDLAKGWRLADAARALGKSGRTLQRELRREGNSYSTVLRRARMDKATGMLAAKSPHLAEIGYCCGYADQAHFQRDFHTAANITPRQYIRLLNHGSVHQDLA